MEPDGILVSYQPAPGGVGWAKLKFRDLPDDLQRQYGYDRKSAADFEKQEAQATDQWRSQMAATDAVAQYLSLAELQSAWVSDGLVSYSVSMDANGKVSAQGTASTRPPEMPPESSSPEPPVSYSFTPLFFGSLPFEGPVAAPAYGNNAALPRFRSRPAPMQGPRSTIPRNQR